MKHNLQGLKVSADGERGILMSREFAAPRELVFDAYTKPELVKRWLLGPDGWSMPVCEIDLRVGGKYRYVWRREKDGSEMGMGGEYREINRPGKLVNTELFDDAWYPGEGVGTMQLTESAGVTSMKYTVVYVSREARDGVLQSPMESGVKVSYDRLETVLGELQSAALR